MIYSEHQRLFLGANDLLKPLADIFFGLIGLFIYSTLSNIFVLLSFMSLGFKTAFALLATDVS